jgi:hypothetical protein
MEKTCPFNPAHSCKRGGCAWWVIDKAQVEGDCAIPHYLSILAYYLKPIGEHAESTALYELEGFDWKEV